VRWTTVSAGFKLVFQLAQVVVLARLLAPADFGLMAVVAAIMAFVQIFADMGVSNAIIHFQEIDERQLSTLYWLNVGASVAVAGVVTALSPAVAWFYEQRQLVPLLALASASLVVAALGQQIRVVGQKRLAFAALAAADLPAYAAGFCVSVITALEGAGVYSLIFGTAATAVTATILLWIVAARGWRPRLALELRGISRFLRFGAYVIGNNVVAAAAAQVDIFIGGRLLGATTIGVYSVPKNWSQRVALAVNPIVTLVGTPVMARAQGDPGLLRNVYLQTVRMVASVNFPIYVAIGLFAPEIVGVMLGPKWADAAILLRIFAAWGLLRSVANPLGSLLTAVGKVDLSFKWNLVWLVVTASAVWIGCSFGALGMTVALLVVMAAGIVPAWRFLVRPQCGAGFGAYFAQMGVPFVVAAAAGGAGFAATLPLASPPIRLVVGVVVIGAAYLALSAAFNRVWLGAMLELAGLRKGARQRPGA
jgi:O-antigen/teichoic acid export membrane protein